MLLSIRSFPRAIVHIDGDAFFASCEQALDPRLKGKLVITGQERGIVASMSYEAKALGVIRGMPIGEVRRRWPDAILLPSDYETYSLLSLRLFEIVRRYTPDVEEYSIDECFADITGLRRPLRMSYGAIAASIQAQLERELGCTFSVGLAPTKTLAKIASKWKKPAGLTIIAGRHIHEYLAELPVEKVWGIGPQTTAFLNKHGLRTALDIAQQSETWVRAHLTKPHVETWQELRGEAVYPVHAGAAPPQQSISKVKTFTPPSCDPDFLFAQLSKNVENACIKARRHQLAAKAVYFFLRTQAFEDAGLELSLSRATALPNDIVALLRAPFRQVYRPRHLYRATGVVLARLRHNEERQLDLFVDPLRIERMERLFRAVDDLAARYGKHALHLGASLVAQRWARDSGNRRGGTTRRQRAPLRSETARRRLGLPMLVGEVE